MTRTIALGRAPTRHALRLLALLGLPALGLAAGCQGPTGEEPENVTRTEIEPSMLDGLVEIMPAFQVDGAAGTDPEQILAASELRVILAEGPELVVARSGNRLALVDQSGVTVEWADDHTSVTFTAADRMVSLEPVGTPAERRLTVARLTLLGLSGQLARIDDLPGEASVDGCAGDWECPNDQFCETIGVNDCRPKKLDGASCSRHGKCLSGCCRVFAPWIFEKQCRPVGSCS